MSDIHGIQVQISLKTEKLKFLRKEEAISSGQQRFEYEQRIKITKQEIAQLQNEILEQGTPSPKLLQLWIASATKSEVELGEWKDNFPEHRYHETDSTTWQPFENEVSITKLIEEYKTKIENTFEVQERFLTQNPLQDTEKADVLNNLSDKVLILDPFAITTENQQTIQFFNNIQAGACLVLLCRSIPFELFLKIRDKIYTTFDQLHICCFLDFKRDYLHFVFPISTKELFFRTLTNIAIVKLRLGTKVQNVPSEKQDLRTKKFTL